MHRSQFNTREKSIYRVTWIGSIVNILLLVLKFIAGIIGHSSALVADAVHSLSDFITDIIVIVFVKISGKPEDDDHKYGHGKYETLATALIGIVLFAVGIDVPTPTISAPITKSEILNLLAKETEPDTRTSAPITIPINANNKVMYSIILFL